jgi:hypothetical protein
MPDRLIDDPDGVGALAATVADQSGIPAAHVAKDFWVTEVLRGVTYAAAEAGIEVVFKGGTSLSKAFSLIQRFSEDVDMLVILDPQDSKNACDRTLKSHVTGASSATELDAISVPAATTTGPKRGARFHYRPPPGTAGCQWPSSAAMTRRSIAALAADSSRSALGPRGPRGRSRLGADGRCRSRPRRESPRR